MPNSQVQVSVSLIEGRPATTSIKIAECFGKQHAHVMRDIQSLIADCPEDFHKSNFGLMSRKVKIGNGAERDDPYYIVFFDGFILLVMGYTGKKALQMKLAYIEAFNAMRVKLEAGSYAQPPALPDWFKPLDEDDTAGYLVSKKFRPIRMMAWDGALWFAGVDIVPYTGRAWSGSIRHTKLPQECRMVVKGRFGFSPNGKGLMMVREDYIEMLFGLKCENRSLAFETWYHERVLPALRQTWGLAALPPAETIKALPKAISAKPQERPDNGESLEIDAASYEYKKSLFDKLADLKQQTETLRETIYLFGRPEARNMKLSPEKHVLYDNLWDCINGAVTGMNIAFYNLRSACRIGSRTDFCKW